MHKRFHNKTVIVTGAGSGIGRATAIRFAEEGANLVLIGRTQETLMATLAMLPEESSWIHDTDHMTVTCDISNQQQVQKMAAAVADRYEHINVLVNNAGVAVSGKVTEMSAEDWQKTLDVNLTGTFYVSQVIIPHLIKSQGNIVNVSSLSGMGGDWKMSAYGAAKAGVTNLTRVMAMEHGEDGVRVNTISPSIVSTSDTKTEMTSGIQESEEKTQKYLACCPLKRIATPEDIAAAITFIASEDARMITGVNLPVDGGLSASSGQPQF